jgi:hypothetical protein
MHVEFTEQAQLWGGWRFGDIAFAVCRAVEVVGPAADVVAMSVKAGHTGPVLVRLTVADADEVARLRFETENGEYVASSWRIDDTGWQAVVNGITLQLSVARDAS